MRKLGMMIMVGLMSVFLFSCSSKEVADDPNNNNDDPIDQQEPNNDEVVVFNDAELDALIRKAIQKEEGDLTIADLENLYDLNVNCDETPVYDLSGLEHAKNLYAFSMRYCTFKSLTPVSKLPMLEYMTISYSSIEEASEPFDTPLLDRLSFIDTNLTNLDFMANAKNVTSANITGNKNLESIEFIMSWNKLDQLNLSYNGIVDVSPLRGKETIKTLRLDHNNVETIDAMSTLIGLEELNLSYNKIQNIDPVLELDNLYKFTIYENHDSRLIDYSLMEVLQENGVEVEYHQ